MKAPQVDVRQLAVRGSEVRPAHRAPRRRFASRVVLPAALLVGFAGVLGWAARDALLPAREVTVMPVLVRHSEVAEEGTPLFSAAGWVEARPTPVLVTAMAEGVVEQLLVVEGDAVEAGQPVAYLLDVDARLALEEAEATLRLRRAELVRTEALLAAARASVEQPVQWEAALAEAESLLAAAETERGSLPFRMRAAEARLQLAEEELERKLSAGEAIARREVEQGRSERARATAELEELRARGPALEQQCAALGRKVAALETQRELLRDERRAQAEAEAERDAAAARVAQAEVAQRTAALRLERMVVRAPVKGRVLELVARPGAKVAGVADTLTHDSSTVVTLYDPDHLQVRADVRFEDVPRVRSGQLVRIESGALGEAISGMVLHATSAADVQKNTLEVKVAIDEPPPVLKPEMLVQVTFLAPPTEETPATPEERLRLFVPRQLVEGEGEGAFVWLADQAAGAARRQAVRTGRAAGELVEVAEGLDPAARLIVGGREGLRAGQRIRVGGEDVTLGVGAG